jgi:hypothetical protein
LNIIAKAGPPDDTSQVQIQQWNQVMADAYNNHYIQLIRPPRTPRRGCRGRAA